MANTLIKTVEAGGMHIHIFETTSAATTETLQLPPGKAIAIPLYVSYIGGTPTTPTFSYVRSTGVLSVITLTATNNILFAVLTDQAVSVPAASLNKVVDGVNRMASLRVVFSQVKIGVADGTDFDLDPASIAAIKANLQTKYDAIAAQVKAEVAANW